MKNYTLRFLFLSLIGILIYSCQNENIEDMPQTKLTLNEKLVTTSEIFSCLVSNTNTFDKLISQFKTKTINDEQVDNAFANYTDWP